MYNFNDVFARTHQTTATTCWTVHYKRFSQSVLIFNDCFQYFLAVNQQIVGISASDTLIFYL